MKLSCPHCAATGNISDALVPDGGREVACPKCRSKFTVSKASPPGVFANPSSGLTSEEKIPVRCPACGASGSVSATRIPPSGTTITCPKCKAPFPVQRPAPARAAVQAAPSSSGGGAVPYRCPQCGREGSLPGSQVPEAGTGMNCPGCNTRFFVKRQDEGSAGAQPAPPAREPSTSHDTIPSISANSGLAGPSVASTASVRASVPTYGGGGVSGPAQNRGGVTGGAIALDDMWSTPSVGRAMAGGVGAASVGAMIWAFITVMTGFQIGWMAIGVGALVGFAVKFFGRGTDQTFGFLGAGLAFFGCMIGNLMASCAFISSDPRNPGFISIFFDALFSPSTAARIMGASFHPLDILFYILAITSGYKVALSSDKA